MGDKQKIKNLSDHESNAFWRSIAIGAIILIVFLSLPHLCSACDGHDHHHHGHDHHHHHHEEPASFKWSKQANEAYEDHQHHHHHHHGEHDHSQNHVHTEKASKPAQSKFK